MNKLPRAFYDRPTAEVAQDLLGKHLVHRVEDVERIVCIVEVEAYVGAHDKAAHTSRGRTPRTRAMFGPPGHAYIYMIYGMHFCMNVVTEAEGTGSGVLLRAAEPIAHVEGNTRGPGLLCRAMGIDRSLYGHDLCSNDLYLTQGRIVTADEIVRTPRIGVHYAGEWAHEPLRFYIAGNPYISRK